MQSVPSEDLEKYYHMKNLSIDEYIKERPVLLIAQNNIDLTIPKQIRTDYGNERLFLIAIKCRLGWSLHCLFGEAKMYDILLYDLIKQSFSLDSLNYHQ